MFGQNSNRRRAIKITARQSRWSSSGGWHFDVMGDMGRWLHMYTDNLLWSLFLTSTGVHAVLLIASPLQAVHKWVRRRSSDSDTAVPYVCACVGSLLWLRYSIYIRDFKLVLLQTYAILMQSFFLVTLLIYRSKRRRLLRAVAVVTLAVSSLFCYMEELSEEDGRRFAGRCASGAQILGSLICPYLIYKAVTSKVIDFVPLAPVAFTWIMELHAIIYSIGIDDFYMMLANTTFFCMDGSLLAMFFIYPTERTTSPCKVDIM